MNRRIEFFKSLCKLNDESLAKILYKALVNKYDSENIIKTKDYIIAKGDLPVGLVAHMDTVFSEPPKEHNIFYDSDKNVIWSEVGLGADDRLGIFLILEIVRMGYRPTIIFTTREEEGGIGASILVSKFENAPVELKYLIQLDRRGANDCVFYDCYNEDFIKYVESFGFKEEDGLFSDISIICPQWKIAGVNLSIGYYNEHHYIETAHMDQAMLTLQKVVHMLEESDNIDKFEYIGIDLSYDCISECGECGQVIWTYETIAITDDNGVPHALCPECFEKNQDSIDWCLSCGRPYLKNGSKYCIVCQVFGDDWEVYDEE